MTTSDQKRAERQTLDLVLAAVGMRPDREPEQGEAPDFTALISGRAIGIEITMYRSGATVEGGHVRRAVETEWDILKRASDDMRRARPEMRDISVGLMFKGAIPPRKQHEAFIQEIIAFVRERDSELTRRSADYWPQTFSAPLMRDHLRTVYLRRDQYAEWYSDITAGYVSRPDASIAAIVAEKSLKEYRPCDELWLAIQCSTRISELVLELDGVADFAGVPSLDPFIFERVFFLAYMGAYEWQRGSGWRRFTGESRAAHGPSFDELKAILADPEWVADPDGKATKVAMDTLREIREGSGDS
jgi:hypothetical protein